MVRMPKRFVLAVVLSAGLGVGCAPTKDKPEEFGPRFEAASRIKDVAVRDQAMRKIAEDAMASENAGATSWAIGQIGDNAVRDEIASKAADHYAEIGRKEVAGAIAESISDDAKRDKVMQKLAETPATKPVKEKEKGKR